MIKLPDYDRGRLDAVIEIYNAINKEDDILDKMNKMLDQTIMIMQDFNKKYVNKVLKK